MGKRNDRVTLKIKEVAAWPNGISLGRPLSPSLAFFQLSSFTLTLHTFYILLN